MKLFADVKKGIAYEILVFKTNISLKKDALAVKPVLSAIPGVLRYNIDQGDIDNVLRLEVLGIRAATIEQLIINAGYFCQELTD